MDINGVATTKGAETKPPERPNHEVKPNEPSTAQPGTKASGDTVQISSQNGGAVEQHGANVQPKLPGTGSGNEVNQNAPRHEAEANNKAVEAEAILRRDYSVEEGELVVKFVDVDQNKVVKEIPPEEIRKIQEAIAKFQDSGVQAQSPDAAENNEIDVTS